MSLVIRTALTFCLLLAHLHGAEHAATLSGRLLDTSGAAIPKASVTLHQRESGETYSAASDASGAYSLSAPAGEYLVDAHAQGLAVQNGSAAVTLRDGESRTLDLTLGVRSAPATIVVTASGTPQSYDQVSKAVDTITAQDAERRDVLALTDAVTEVPGLRVSQRGGPGSFSSIQVRGMRTFDTSILIDGMRFRDVGSTQGDASSFLSDLLLADTERIEVLRGAGSSLYGTNAIGGVVNMVTDAAGGPLHGELKLEGGGLGQFRGVARIGGGALHNRLHASLGLAHLNVTEGVDGDDRYRNTSGQGVADYAVTPKAKLSARLLTADVYGQLNAIPYAAPASALPLTGYVHAVAPSDNQLHFADRNQPFTLGSATFVPSLDDPDYYRTAQFVSTMIAWQQQVSAPLSYRIAYQGLLSNRNVVNGPLGSGYQPDFRSSDQFNGRIDTLQAQAHLLAGRHQLVTAEYEFEREFFDSPSTDANPDPANRVNSRTRVSEVSHTAAVQDQIRLLSDRLQISLSGRFQHFDLSPPEFLGTVPVYAGSRIGSAPDAYTGDASIAYFLRRSGTKLRTHVGNGYRKPSLYERFGTSFYGGFFSAYGDPQLKPERSVAVDAGVDQYLLSNRLRLSASYFYTHLQEVIGFDFSGLIQPATDPYGRSLGYFNTGGGVARGAELSAEWTPVRTTRIQAAYTYTDARDRFSQFGDGTLQTPRIWAHSFSLVAYQQFGKHWDAAFDLLVASDYLFPFSGRSYVFDGPRKAGITGGYSRPLNERLKLRLSARIDNLANQVYYEDGFRTPKRWAVGGATLSF